MAHSRQDFSVINEYVTQIKNSYNFTTLSNAFYFFVFDLLFDLQDDEIRDCITDDYFVKNELKTSSGGDRGIDAIYIEEDNNNKAIIHLFNFKYCDSYDKAIKHFPSNELDKIFNFLSLLFEGQDNTKTREFMNPILYEKVEEIWEVLNNHNPTFILHICSNHYEGLIKHEHERLEQELNKYYNISVEYHLTPILVEKLTKKGKQQVNAKIRATKKELFEKSDGDIKALIVNLDVRDCIRIVLNSKEIRETVDLDDYKRLTEYEILEDAFEDNVRVYLKQKPRINQNIKRTVLEEGNRFFYFNNGLTITCSDFQYPPNQSYPLIELENIQIVNGSQTIHALYDALKENYEQLENAYILCRIYQIRSPELSAQIAQYTNSQNPVKNRDIRSIDYVQLKLEKELLSRNLYYERKKNLYKDKPKSDRLDAEKVGQILLSFYEKMPSEAKNKKSIIFTEDIYDKIFNDTINADKVLLPYELYTRIENEKEQIKIEISSDEELFNKKSYIAYVDYYVLYLLHELANLKAIPIHHDNLDEIWNLYPTAIKILETIIEKEKSDKKNYAHNTFFKSNNPKQRFEDIKSNKKELQKILNS